MENIILNALIQEMGALMSLTTICQTNDQEQMWLVFIQMNVTKNLKAKKQLAEEVNI